MATHVRLRIPGHVSSQLWDTEYKPDYCLLSRSLGVLASHWPAETSSSSSPETTPSDWPSSPWLILVVCSQGEIIPSSTLECLFCSVQSVLRCVLLPAFPALILLCRLQICTVFHHRHCLSLSFHSVYHYNWRAKQTMAAVSRVCRIREYLLTTLVCTGHEYWPGTGSPALLYVLLYNHYPIPKE